MLRWEDCVKRDVRKAGEEETGRRRQDKEEGGKGSEMRWWRSCGQHLTSDKGRKRKRQSLYQLCLGVHYLVHSPACPKPGCKRRVAAGASRP